MFHIFSYIWQNIFSFVKDRIFFSSPLYYLIFIFFILDLIIFFYHYYDRKLITLLSIKALSSYKCYSRQYYSRQFRAWSRNRENNLISERKVQHYVRSRMLRWNDMQLNSFFISYMLVICYAHINGNDWQRKNLSRSRRNNCKLWGRHTSCGNVRGMRGLSWRPL